MLLLGRALRRRETVGPLCDEVGVRMVHTFGSKMTEVLGLLVGCGRNEPGHVHGPGPELIVVDNVPNVKGWEELELDLDNKWVLGENLLVQRCPHCSVNSFIKVGKKMK